MITRLGWFLAALVIAVDARPIDRTDQSSSSPPPEAVVMPLGMAPAPDGSVLVADPGALRIWRIAGRRLEVVAGSGRGGESEDGVPAVEARLSGLSQVAVDRAGNVFFTERSESSRARIRKIDRSGRLTTIADTTDERAGEQIERDSPGFVSGLAVDAAGNVFFAERLAHRIRKVGTNGVVTTFADTVGSGIQSDLVLDRDGRLLVASGAQILALDMEGKSNAIAGTGEAGYSGDGGPATRAQFSQHLGLALDRQGALVVADLGNDRVRRIASDGTVTTIGGAGLVGKDRGCSLCPWAAAIAGDGTTYVSAGSNGLLALSSDRRFRQVFTLPAQRVRDLKPSRDAFLRELLDPEYTLVTRRFDDYTSGSYHVDKIDLYNGLRAAANRSGKRLRGVLIVGPSGVLWSYGVTAFFDEGDRVRANHLVMPHARITWKGTALLTRQQYADAIASLTSAAQFSKEVPPAKDKTLPYPEWAHSVLLADLSAGRPVVRYSGVDLFTSNPEREQFIDALNTLEALFQTTYGR
jgi:sugar lactone lactonase YvrE